MIDVVYEITLKTSAWNVVQNFIQLKFVRELLNTIPNMDQLQKWHQLIENLALLFINIVIIMHYTLQYLRSIALIQDQQIINYIYMISYVRRFHIDPGSNYRTGKDEHLFIILQKRINICDLSMGE